MSNGFIILAENTKSVDYIACAEVLALSIKKSMPHAHVSLLTTEKQKPKSFDKLINLPYGDLCSDQEWKLANDWQVFTASPYDHTIKIEADMVLPRSIDHWWDVLKHRSIVVSTTIRDFRGNISDNTTYRKFIIDNNLPNVYNALVYFDKSALANKFFLIVKDVFLNWSSYKAVLKCKVDEIATTDWAYAIAAHILGVEKTTLPSFTEMSMVHMKQFVNDLPTPDWTDILVYECLPDQLRINTFPQQYPFHYAKKEFSSILRKGYT